MAAKSRIGGMSILTQKIMNRVTDNELADFIHDFGWRNSETNEKRLLAKLTARFYGRENPRQLLYRCEHLHLIRTDDEKITIL